MSASDLLWRSEWFVSAVSSLIVLGITIESYRRRPRRSVMLIAIGAAVSFLYVTLSWIVETTSPVFWSLLSLANIGAALLWIAGIYRLLAEIRRIDEPRAESGAAPNGGPATPSAKSGVAEGPPSGS
jgi:hypothetical protein